MIFDRLGEILSAERGGQNNSRLRSYSTISPKVVSQVQVRCHSHWAGVWCTVCSVAPATAAARLKITRVLGAGVAAVTRRGATGGRKLRWSRPGTRELGGDMASIATLCSSHVSSKLWHLTFRTLNSKL